MTDHYSDCYPDKNEKPRKPVKSKFEEKVERLWMENHQKRKRNFISQQPELVLAIYEGQVANGVDEDGTAAHRYKKPTEKQIMEHHPTCKKCEWCFRKVKLAFPEPVCQRSGSPYYGRIVEPTVDYCRFWEKRKK